MKLVRPMVFASSVLLAAAALTLTACSSSATTARLSSPVPSGSAAGSISAGSETAGSIRSEPAPAGSLTVYAAASLKVSFDQLRAVFIAQHPTVDFPEISYDGSATLVTQLQNGAPADVFASADEENMDRVAALISGRVDFATNTLQIAVAPGNPKNITDLADLANPGLITVVCAAQVPCGAASHRALDAAGVDLRPASEEQNVTAVLTKVATGDADAGLVYATDVKSSGGKVQGIDFPQAAKAVNTYPIAMLKDSKNSAAAKAFIDMVSGPEGQKVLAAVGFGKP